MGEVKWKHLTSFSTGLEAEMARTRLDAEGIPALIKSDAAGVFGAGFLGSVPSGFELSVPGPDLERARGLLE